MTLAEIRSLIDDSNDFGAALRFLEATPKPWSSEAHYLAGFCRVKLAAGSEDLRLAEREFTLALAGGFDRYWATFMRAQARWALGKHLAAMDDFAEATDAAHTPEALAGLSNAVHAVLRSRSRPRGRVGACLRAMSALIADVPGRVEQGSGATSDPTIVRADFGDFQAFVYAGDIAQRLAVSDRHEPDRTPTTPSAFIDSFSRGGDLLHLAIAVHLANGVRPAFLDIGANVGIDCIRAAHFARRLGVTLPIYAFEPGVMRHLLPWTLKANGLTDTVQFMPAAACERGGPVIMSAIPGMSVDNRSTESAAQGGRRPQTFLVDGVRLDDFVADHGPFDAIVVKLDTQGAEPGILRGFRETLGRIPVTLLTEFSPGAADPRERPAEMTRSLLATHDLFDVHTSRDRFDPIDAADTERHVAAVLSRPAPWTDLIALPRNAPWSNSLAARLESTLCAQPTPIA